MVACAKGEVGWSGILNNRDKVGVIARKTSRGLGAGVQRFKVGRSSLSRSFGRFSRVARARKHLKFGGDSVNREVKHY